MTLDTIKLDHICQNTRREFRDTYKDLDLIFIPFVSGKAKEGFEKKRLEIKNHPAGASLIDKLKQYCLMQENRTYFWGLTCQKNKGLLLNIGKKEYLAIFFIHADTIDDIADAHMEVYHLCWHALRLYEYHKNGAQEHLIEDEKVIKPQGTPIETARTHMLADAFAASLLELQGKKYFRKLAKKRCLQTLSATRKFIAEHFAYPATADVIASVYRDVMDILPEKLSDIEKAREVALELGETYNDAILKHWQSFALCAQQMAWMGAAPEEILSFAIYTSEDPYVRSVAYLVADILTMEPTTLKKTDAYNPFTEHEANDRRHQKICQELTQIIFQQPATKERLQVFYQLAEKHNEMLLDGHITGWCGYSILKLCDDIQRPDLVAEDPLEHQEEFQNNFQKNIMKIQWLYLYEAGEQAMKLKRLSSPRPVEELITFFQTKKLSELEEVFSRLPPKKSDHGAEKTAPK